MSDSCPYCLPVTSWGGSQEMFDSLKIWHDNGHDKAQPPADQNIEQQIDKWWNEYCGSVMFAPEAKSKLLALISKQVIKELTPFTDLQSEIEATHFEPCNFCGQVSHNCNCAPPLIWVERIANYRIAELKQTPPTPKGDELGGLERPSDEK